MISLKHLIKKIGNNLSSRFNKSYHCYGEPYFIHRKAILLLKNINAINIGSQVYIGANTIISVRDHNFPNAYKDSHLSIGKKTYIGENNNIRASGGKITIGENCLISQHVTIVTTNHGIKKGILIKEQEWSKDNNFIQLMMTFGLGQEALSYQE